MSRNFEIEEDDDSLSDKLTDVASNAVTLLLNGALMGIGSAIGADLYRKWGSNNPAVMLDYTKSKRW